MFKKPNSIGWVFLIIAVLVLLFAFANSVKEERHQEWVEASVHATIPTFTLDNSDDQSVTVTGKVVLPVGTGSPMVGRLTTTCVSLGIFDLRETSMFTQMGTENGLTIYQFRFPKTMRKCKYLMEVTLTNGITTGSQLVEVP